MTGKKVKTTVKAKVTPTTKKSKAIKPKMGRGIGGFIMTSVKLKVEKDKKQKEQSNG